MNGKLQVDKLEKPDGKPVELTGQSAAKAFGRINQTNNSLAETLNVSSVTDVGTGTHAFNWTNVFAGATYNAITEIGSDSGSAGAFGAGGLNINYNATGGYNGIKVGSAPVMGLNYSGNYYDATVAQIQALGDLA